MSNLIRVAVLLCATVAALSTHAAAGVVEVAAGGDIAAAVASLRGQPGVVLLGAGDFHVPATIHLASGQSLQGTYGLSSLRWTGPATAPVIAAVGKRGAKVGRMEPVKGKTIHIQASAPGHVQLIYDLDPNIPQHEWNEVLRTDKGFRLRRRPTMVYSEGADIWRFDPVERASVRALKIDSGNAANAILSDYTTEFEVDQVEIRGNSPYGILVRNSYSTTIERSRMEGTAACAIRMERSAAGTIRGNRFITVGMTAIFAGYGTWFLNIVDNEIQGSGQSRPDGTIRGGDGITISGGGNLLIDGNRIMGTHCYGMWLTRAVQRSVISGNTISGGITAGILLNGNDETTVRNTVITGNIIFDNDGGAVGAHPARGVVLTANALGMFDGRVIGAGKGSEALFVGQNVTGPALTRGEMKTVKSGAPAAAVKALAKSQGISRNTIYIAAIAALLLAVVALLWRLRSVTAARSTSEG